MKKQQQKSPKWNNKQNDRYCLRFFVQECERCAFFDAESYDSLIRKSSSRFCWDVFAFRTFRLRW